MRLWATEQSSSFCIIYIYLLSFQIVEKGKSELPHWLELDEGDGSLKGVPSANEVGKEIFLEALPIMKVDNGTANSDIFSMKVKEDSVHSETTAVPVKNIKNDEELKPIKCPQGSSVTMATIMVDTDMSILRPRDRVDMMESMCHHLGMPTELVRLQPLGNRPMFDSLALVAGPGDVKRPMYSGAMVQWEVGCGNVFANHMPVLQQLENTAHDGSMGQAVGHGIIGWHVTNNKPQAAKRIKRHAYIHATPTPQVLPPIPTKHVGVTSRIDATDEVGVPPSPRGSLHGDTRIPRDQTNPHRVPPPSSHTRSKNSWASSRSRDEHVQATPF